MKQFCCPLKTSLLFFALVVEYLWTWQKQSESLDCDVESCTLLYSDCSDCSYTVTKNTVTQNTVIQTVTLVPSSWALQPTCLCACLVPWYTLLAECIYCNRPSHLHTEHSTPYRGNDNLYNIWIIWFAMRSGGAVFFSVYLIICLTHEHLNDANK